MRMIVAAALAVGLFTAAGAQDKEKDVKPLLDKIEAAAKAAGAAKDDKERKAHYDDMIKLAKEAKEKDPSNPAIHFALGSAHAAKRENTEALVAFNKVIELAKDAAVAYDRRGDVNLKLGNFEQAVKDFDKFHELSKASDTDKAHHWRRGIALYYDKKYKEGADQFTHHQTVNKQDVENAVWHFLCNAKVKKDTEAARKELIAITGDDRVPMKEVLELYKTKGGDPKKVLDAAEAVKNADAKREAQFYANLYVALYFEAEGDEKKSLEFMEKAKGLEIGHYMWDVAAVHVKVRKP